VLTSELNQEQRGEHKYTIMKKILLAFFFLLTSIAYAQSVEILPGNNVGGNIISNSGAFPVLNMYPDASIGRPDKMIISHSPGYPEVGLQYENWNAQFNFLGLNVNAMTIRLNEPNNIGIGNSSPNAKLDISNASDDETNASLRLLHTSETGFNRLNFENMGRTDKWGILANVGSAAADSRWNLWHTTTGNVITMTGDGNVGIRNDNPIFPLHINSLNYSSGSNTGAAAIGFLTTRHLTFDSYGINAWDDTSASILHLNTESSGRVEVSGSGANASDLRVNGFTRLGGLAAPNIKMKKLSGTTDADDNTSVAHGLAFDKMIAVNVLINFDANNKYPPQEIAGSSVVYRMYVNTSDISLKDVSANLQSKAFTILITCVE
jgi:hypothetical protein